MMNAPKLSPIAQAVNERGAQIASVASADVKVRDKWLALGHALHNEDGVTVAMLTPATEKAPNDAADPSLIETVERYVIAGVSASKKGLRFDTANPRATGKAQMGKGPHAWTVSDLLSLTRDELRTIQDESLKGQRRYWQQIVGTICNRVRAYVDRFENPEKHRAEKKEKQEKKADAPTIPATMSGYLAALHAMNAGINTIGLSARDAETIREPLLQCIVLLDAAKKAADRAAK